MTGMFFTQRAFLIDTTERAVSTTAQAAIGVLGTAGLGLLDADWQAVASVSLLAGVVAVLKALAKGRSGASDG